MTAANARDPAWAGGGVGDGITDNSSVFSAITAALPARGGEILIPPGTYNSSAQINLNGKASMSIGGTGGMSGGADTSTILQYTAAGTTPFISARSVAGLYVHDMQILYSNPAFTGNLIDLSTLSADTSYVVFERCFIGGEGVYSAAQLVNMNKAIVVTFRDCIFEKAAYAVVGRTSVGDYCNVVRFENCTFANQTALHVKNAGEAWSFEGCTFEPITNSSGVNVGAGAYGFDGTQTFKGLSFKNCWFGDAPLAGDWLTVSGSGFVFEGNEIGAGLNALRLYKGNGYSIQGNSFKQLTTALLFDPAVGVASPSQYNISGNAYSGVTNMIIGTGGGYIPTGSLIQGSGSDAQLDLFGLPVFTAAVSDASFTATWGTPPNGTVAIEDVTGVRKWCVRVGGTWYKVVIA